MYNFSRANLEQKKLISKYKLVNQNCNIHLSCKFISCSSIAGITVMDGYMDIFHIWYKQISNCMNKLTAVALSKETNTRVLFTG